MSVPARLTASIFVLSVMWTTVLLTVSSAVPAQRLVYVPDASPSQGSCNGIPFGSGTEWRYHVLVTAGQLGSLPGRIVDLAFTPCWNGTFTANPFEVRMAHSYSAQLTKNFQTNFGGNLTTLYQGAAGWRYAADQWSPIGLQRHFDFDGRNSLVVEIRYKAGQGGASFRRSDNLPRAYQYGTAAYASPMATFLDTGGLKMRFTVKEIYLTGSGSGAPGTAYRFALTSRTDPGRAYQLGTSLGRGPVPIGSRLLHLWPDTLLLASVSNTLPSVFSGYVGVLDASGQATARLHLPSGSWLRGITFHTAFIVLDPKAPYGIQEISNTASFQVP